MIWILHRNRRAVGSIPTRGPCAAFLAVVPGQVLKCIYSHLDYKPFMRYKTRDDSFISDKAPTARVLNGLKNEPSYEFSGEVIFKINVF
jgi:hypothetical protein